MLLRVDLGFSVGHRACPVNRVAARRSRQTKRPATASAGLSHVGSLEGRSVDGWEGDGVHVFGFFLPAGFPPDARSKADQRPAVKNFLRRHEQRKTRPHCEGRALILGTCDLFDGDAGESASFLHVGRIHALEEFRNAGCGIEDAPLTGDLRGVFAGLARGSGFGFGSGRILGHTFIG